MVGPTHPAMKCLVITAVLLLILLGCSGPSGQSEDPEGQWVGSFEVAEGPVYLQLGLQKTTKGTNLAARFMLPGPPSPVAQFRLEPPLLHFELPTGSDKLVFSGEILGQTISGTVLSEGKQGTFKLVREAQVDPEVYDDYIGTYELDEPGGVVFIGRYDQLNQEPPYPLEKSALYYVKESGRTGVLFPSSDTSFFSGTTFFAPVPIEVEATFVRNENGKVTGLLWNQEGSDGAKAARSRAYSEEEVVFQNGEVTLAGRLLVPSTAGPHPAVVVISGGNGIPVNRNQGYQIVGDVFARRGIAALIYDKRGGGRSTGDWRTAGPEELAADALAAVHFLRGRGDIDPNQVGLWGISEGGWIGPLTASRCEEVAFLIVVSADGTPRFDSNLRWLQDQWLPADGFSPDEIEQAVSFSRLEHEFARTGKQWEKLEAAVEKARDKKWFAYTQMGSRGVTSRDHWFWTWHGLWAAHDPALALQKVSCPILAIWGETEGRFGKASVERPLQEAGHRDYTMKVFPKGGHGLWLEEEYGRWSTVKKYVPGYFETMTDWILQRVDLTE